MSLRSLAVGLACGAGALGSSPSLAAEPAAVLETYLDIAHAVYEDSYETARDLRAAIDELLAMPSAENLEAARSAWRAARVPYQQSEAFRFGNGVVDAWEGRVNSWPLDEGLIDYVDASAYGDVSDENRFFTANVVANESLEIGGETIDASAIDTALLERLHEIDAIEANVSRGYHAIEFLLWGQDLNGTGPGAGQRPWTDYSLTDCTGGHCDRRRDYLTAATDLLVVDLEEMVGDWTVGGAARAALLDGDLSRGLAVILTGLGSLSYGELAGERMQLGLLLNDPEEEQDCFSDNTYNSHYNDQVGMMSVYEGRYVRVDGSIVEGQGIDDLLAERAPAVSAKLASAMQATLAAMDAMKRRAETIEAYDQMIGPGNAAGNAVVQLVIDRLKEQARAVEDAVAALDLEPISIEGSESLDNPEAVFFQ